mgnify:CR=1 FL=1
MAGKFHINLTRIVEKTKARIDTVVQKITLDIFGNIIIMSPVKTGRFRANWTASMNGYGSGVYETVDPGGFETSTKMAAVVMNAGSGKIVYLVNNLPYAYRLEYEGHSKQAPHGMVRVTVAEFQQRFNNVVSSL